MSAPASAAQRPDLRRWAVLAVTTVAVPLVPFALVGELPSHVWLAATDGHAVQIGSFGALLLAAGAECGCCTHALAAFFLACITGDALYAFALVASGAHFLPKGAWAPALLAPIGIPVAGYLLWRRFSRRKAPPSRLASAAAGLNSNGGDAQPRSHHRPREPL